MCIIAIKPAGVALPDAAAIRQMWQANPDGAGLMYPRKGAVHIDKGYMKLKALQTRLDNLHHDIDVRETPIILHFRIATSGGTRPENTHPFPVCESLKRLKKQHTTGAFGVVHNGIIPIEPRHSTVSDTMEYILAQLGTIARLDPTFLTNPRALKLIETQTMSKLAFLGADGTIATVGAFHSESDGMRYSNYSHWQATYSDGWLDYLADQFGIIDHGSNRPTKEWLTWLDPEAEYIETEDGELIEAEDFLVDATGRLYVYDFSKDQALRVNGARPVPIFSDSSTTAYSDIDAELFKVG